MKFPKWLNVYGDVSYRNKKCPKESLEQITFFNILTKDYPDLRAVALHPRNEGKRSNSQTTRHKAEGMTPGASDIIILGSIPFVCELKRQDHTLSAWEDSQLDFLESCYESGCFSCVALGYKASMDALDEWMLLREST